MSFDKAQLKMKSKPKEEKSCIHAKVFTLLKLDSTNAYRRKKTMTKQPMKTLEPPSSMIKIKKAKGAATEN